MTWHRKEITANLVDVETGDYLDFLYNPNDILDQKSTTYAAIKILGMSHPRYQYVACEPRKISFKILFFKGPVKESVDWLRSLLYPEHARLRRPQKPSEHTRGFRLPSGPGLPRSEKRQG